MATTYIEKILDPEWPAFGSTELMGMFAYVNLAFTQMTVDRINFTRTTPDPKNWDDKALMSAYSSMVAEVNNYMRFGGGLSGDYGYKKADAAIRSFAKRIGVEIPEK